MIRTEIANAMHAEALRLIESGAPDGAIVLLSALNFFTPGHAGVRDPLGRAHHEFAKQRLATGHLEESITSFNHSLSVSGGKVETHAALAAALRLGGDVKSRTLLLESGIGDFLQCVPFLKSLGDDLPRIVVVTHFKDADSFFAALHIRVTELHHFSNVEEFQRAHVTISATKRLSRCPRQQYFEQPPLHARSVAFAHKRPVLGVHLGGSSFSLPVQRKRGAVTKDLPVALLHRLLFTNRFDIILFGSRVELDSLTVSESDSLRFACYPNVVDSLALAVQCEAFVGSDSAVKTMTSMLKIPTIVWLADHPDPARDCLFIDPYVRDRVMHVFRFREKVASLENGVRFTLETLANLGLLDKSG
jgi:hypothetical protein